MPEPLHPLTVHLPLALALLLPLFALAAMIVAARGAPARPVWLVVVALQAILGGATLLATETGEQEEHVVASVVPRDALERHEERAEQFHTAAWITLALAGLGLLPGRSGRAAMVLTILATVAVLGLAWRTGEAGGELVYRHGAANAYK